VSTPIPYLMVLAAAIPAVVAIVSTRNVTEAKELLAELHKLWSAPDYSAAIGTAYVLPGWVTASERSAVARARLVQFRRFGDIPCVARGLR
jgi:hypothetical protein